MRDRAIRTITMSQGNYMLDVFEMEDCKFIATPFDVNSKLVKLTKECAVQDQLIS